MITGLATIAECARVYTKLWRFSRLYWDDFFAILGWFFSVPLAIQATLSYGKDTKLSGGSNVFLSRPITQLFFYTSLWSIKMSFLILFKRIGICALNALRKYWTTVSVFTAAVYLILWTINPYSCWVRKGLIACEMDPGVIRLTPIQLGLATAFDVLTDSLSKSLLPAV